MITTTVNSLKVTKKRALSPAMLGWENQRFAGTAGVSSENRQQGFRAAFMDSASGVVHLSRFADGRPAPMHLLEGLPAELVIRRTRSGRVEAVKPSVVSGFLRGERFFTREQAAAFVVTSQLTAA